MWAPLIICGNSATEPQALNRSLSTLYTKDGTFTITLIASNQYGCADTATINNAVKVVKGADILIPNGFTPSVYDGSTIRSQQRCQ